MNGGFTGNKPAPPGMLAEQVNTKKYNTIQVLRFIAAFAVLVLHSTYYTKDRLDDSTYVFAQGTNGVGLFFTISGFVIFMSSVKLVNKAFGWKEFAVKRIVRIVPIYWIINTLKLAVLLVAPSMGFNERTDLIFILKSYLFIPARNVDGIISPFYGIGWTLNFEMFFYFLFAIALAFRLKPIPFLSVIFVPLTIVAAFTQNSWPDIQFYAHPLVLNFLYGMMIASWVTKGKLLPQIPAIAAIIAGLLFLFVPGLMPVGKTETFSFSYTYLLNGVCCLLVIYGAVSIDALWGPKLATGLVYLGGASYSLYLIHPLVAPLPPVLLNMLHIKQPWLSVISSIVLSLAAGVIFYRFCEKPVTKYLTRMVKVSAPSG